MGWADKTFRRSADPVDSAEATDLNKRAMQCLAQGRHAQAEPLLRRALAIQEKDFGSNHPVTALNLGPLANLCAAQGHYAQAESFYKRALATQEGAFGPDHPKVAMILENMARLYRKIGRAEDAQRLERRAVTIRATDTLHSSKKTTLSLCGDKERGSHGMGR
jgi:tetratricopeptide (TPR) repeat protein